MDAVTQSAVRGANGRFLPGQSGNPSGKRPGTRNRATVLAEALREGEAEGLARTAVDRAMAGDGVTLRFCLGRLFAKPRGQAIRLELPEGARAGDVVAAFDATLAAMAAGEITPEEALAVTRVLDGRRRALAAWAAERVAGAEEENPLPLAGEGRVRAGAAAGAAGTDGAVCAPTPSPRPSPASGRGSHGGRTGSAFAAGAMASHAALTPPDLHSACNTAARRALAPERPRRHGGMPMRKAAA